MEKIRQEVTSNLKTGEELRTYDKVTYHCQADDTWVNVETPQETATTA